MTMKRSKRGWRMYNQLIQPTALMIFGMIVLMIGAFVNFAYADENKWTKEDTSYQALFSSLLMTDWLQTKEAVSNGVRENNPILGEHPSQNSIDAFGASVMLGHLAISKILPKDFNENSIFRLRQGRQKTL